MSENIYQNYDDNLFTEVTIPKKYWYFRYKWMCGSKWEDADGVFVGEFADLLLEVHSYDPKSWLIMSQQITSEDYDKLEGIVG